MLTDQEFKAKCQELKEKAAMIRAQLSRNTQALDNQGSRPANVPMRRYSLDDQIELARPARRPASTREARPYINVPGPDQTWKELNQWRVAYGLSPVVALIG